MTRCPGDGESTKTHGPPKTRWKTLSGPLATLALAGILFWLDALDVHVPNPVLFFANAIVFSAFFGGMAAGMASVAVTLGFALVYWSVPGQLFHYVPRDVSRLIVLAMTMPPLGLLVGWLRRAYERKRSELADQNAQLVDQLRRRAILEEKQRDMERILRHDLRSPLTGVISVPEVLAEDDNLTTEQRRMLSMISAAGRKMLGQINNSLEMAKIEDGSYEPDASPCDPAMVLRENFNILTLGAPADAVAFHLVEPVPLVLVTDRRILDVILLNLLRNAAEASDPGSPVVVNVRADRDDCVITIANNRPVPEEVRPRFFEKYVTSGKPGGTGLGTYSALLMTRALGGDIAMETSDRGTRVTLRLPLNPRDDCRPSPG